MIIRRQIVFSLLLSAVLFMFIVVLRSLQVQSSSSLGRLVFTDYPKANHKFTVGVIDLEQGKQVSSEKEVYQDIGFLWAIDQQNFYASLCFAQSDPRFCSAPVSTMVTPKEVSRFEQIKPFWKDNYGVPVWSPDGTHIAFSIVDKIPQKSSLFNSDISVMKADGTNRVDLTPDEIDGGYYFSWSPDGKQIAFACSNDQKLCISNLDGSHLKKLDLLREATVDGVEWSPSGEQILFTLLSKDYSTSGLYLVNADGSNMHLLLPDKYDLRVHFKWSPDGMTILFVTGFGDIANVYVVKADGTDLRNLSQGVNGYSFGAVWSPNSMNVAFFSWQGEKDVFLYVADASRGYPQKITDNSTLHLLDAGAPEVFWIP